MKLKSGFEHKQVQPPVCCPQGIHFPEAAGLGEIAVGAHDDDVTVSFEESF